MTQKLTWIFGIVLLLVGVLGYVPGLATDGMLLGLFKIDAMHNVVHIVTGLLAIAAAWAAMYQRLFFKVFGVVYALVAVIGFVQGDTVLGLISTNMADHLLHLAIAVIALWIGFGMKESSPAPAPAMGGGMGQTM